MTTARDLRLAVDHPVGEEQHRAEGEEEAEGDVDHGRFSMELILPHDAEGDDSSEAHQARQPERDSQSVVQHVLPVADVGCSRAGRSQDHEHRHQRHQQSVWHAHPSRVEENELFS